MMNKYLLLLAFFSIAAMCFALYKEAQGTVYKEPLKTPVLVIDYQDTYGWSQSKVDSLIKKMQDEGRWMHMSVYLKTLTAGEEVEYLKTDSLTAEGSWGDWFKDE